MLDLDPPFVLPKGADGVDQTLIVDGVRTLEVSNIRFEELVYAGKPFLVGERSLQFFVEHIESPKQFRVLHRQVGDDAIRLDARSAQIFGGERHLRFIVPSLGKVPTRLHDDADEKGPNEQSHRRAGKLPCRRRGDPAQNVARTPPQGRGHRERLPARGCRPVIKHGRQG
jgi:hypothetical protein